jgi:two-component system, cell cycle sensor histidine kinase and response regulator CckA
MSPESQEVPLKGTETILVVDDQEADRKLITLSLSELGYSTIEASGGKEALEIFQKNPKIDLILTDILMPEMDGVELVERIRNIAPKMKILFISGYEQRYAQKLSGQRVDVVSKTYNLQGLAQKVRLVLDQGQGNRITKFIKKIVSSDKRPS